MTDRVPVLNQYRRMGSIVFRLLFVAAATAELGAQGTRTVPSKQASDIDAVLALAYSTQPEVGADALIRVAKLRSRVNQKTSADLLERAFTLAGGATYPLSIRSVTAMMDSPSGMIELTLRQGLDRVGLQSRVVDELISLGLYKNALQLFQSIQFPDLTSSECRDASVPDPSRFYVTLGSVAVKTFSAEEQRKGHDVSFLMAYVSRLSSFAQVDSLAQLLLLQTKKPGFAGLTGALAAKLRDLPTDDRSFSGWKGTAVGAVTVLAMQCDQAGFSGDPLRTAMRTYLIRQYQASHCTDSLPPREYKKEIGNSSGTPVDFSGLLLGSVSL